MDTKKKVIIAIVIFIFLGLTVFTFANPNESENKAQGEGNGTTETETKTDKKDDSEKEVNNEVNNNENTNNENNVNDQENNTNLLTTNTDDSYNNALEAVVNAEEKIDEESYNAAVDLVDKVTNEESKEELNNRLEEVKNSIDAKALVATLESMTNNAANKTDMDSARNYRTDEDIENLVAALSNEELKEELQSTLATLALLLDDEEIKINIEDGAILSETAKIEIEDDNEVTITLTKDEEDKEITNGTEVSDGDGIYTLMVVDEAFNSETITFTIDTTDPMFNVESGSHSTGDIKIVVDDLTLDYVEIYNQDEVTNKIVTDSEFTLTDEATYRVTAYDKAGHSKELWVAIDKSNPGIDGVEDGKVYKEAKVTVTDKFLTEVLVNGETKEGIVTTGTKNEGKELVLEFTEEGTYTIVAKDKVGNEQPVTFTIDRTKPVITGVEDGKYYKTDVTPIVTDENFKNATLKYNGVHIKSYKVGDTLVNEGTYTLVATDLAMNKTKLITFTIDKTKPVTTGVEDGAYYKTNVTPIVTDENFKNATLKYNGEHDKSYKVGDTLEKEGTYTLVATDLAMNKTKLITFTIDKTKPVITGVEDGAYYKTDVTPMVTDENLKNATLKYNGEHDKSYKVGDTLEKEGTYTLVATDLAMNKTKLITFTIDKTAPGYNYVGIMNIDQVTEGYAKVGDRIWVYVVVDEHLSVEPTITINGVKADIIQTEDGANSNADLYKYVGEVTMTDEMSEGEITFTIDGFKDLAGNPNTEALTNSNINEGLEKIILDKTMPTLPTKEDTVGTDPYYSKVSFKPQDNNAIDYYIINETKIDSQSNINYEDIKTNLVEGENTIVLYDIAGNKVEKTFYMDWTAPKFQPEKWSVTLEADKNAKFECPDMTAYVTDSLSGVKSVKLDEWYAQNWSIPDQTKTGNFVCRYYSTDNAGNTVANDIFYTVVDTTRPTVTANLDENGNKDITVELGSEYNEPGATVTDNVDADRTMSPSEVKYYSLDMVYDKAYTEELNESGNFVNANKIGKYLLIYETKDEAGNISDRNALISKRWVIVKDTTAPTLEITETSERFYVRGTDLTNIKYTIKKDGEQVHTVDGATSTGGNYFSIGSNWFGYGEYTIEAVDEGGNKTIKTVILEDVINVYTFEDLKSAFAIGGKVKLMNDIVLEEEIVINTGISIDFNMNGKKITLSDNFKSDSAFNMKKQSSLTIGGNGVIDLEDHISQVIVIPRGNLTINDGTYTKNYDPSYELNLDKWGNEKNYFPLIVGINFGGTDKETRGSTIINGGYFDGGLYDSTNNKMINSTINLSWGHNFKIYGGTFVGYSPALGDEANGNQGYFLEGQTTVNEIPEGYTITELELSDGRPTYTVIYTK